MALFITVNSWITNHTFLWPTHTNGSVVLCLHWDIHTLILIHRPLKWTGDTSTQWEKPAEATTCRGMWRCQTWKCQTVPTHHPKPFLTPSVCVCVELWSVYSVCPWAAVTSKQQSFQMTGPGDDSSATATGQVREGSLPPSDNPPPPSLYLSPSLSSVLWLLVTGLAGFLLFNACGFLATTCLHCAFSPSMFMNSTLSC